MSEPKTAGGEKTGDDEQEIAARFPKSDEVSLARDIHSLPEPPKGSYERPQTRRDTDPLPEGTKSVLANVGGGSRNMRSMGMAGTIGISLAVSIVVGTGLGYVVDKFLLHSTGTPWGLIVGFLLGTTSGFINLVRVANDLNRDE